MNTFLKAIVLSISTALVAAPVMAAPQEHQPNKHYTQQQHKAPMHPQQLHKTHSISLLLKKRLIHHVIGELVKKFRLNTLTNPIKWITNNTKN